MNLFFSKKYTFFGDFYNFFGGMVNFAFGISVSTFTGWFIYVALHIHTYTDMRKIPVQCSYLIETWSIIRVIPQGTVDNNLGPDRSAGPKALDPNYFRQPTHWLHDLCLEVLTVHGIELRLFLGPRHSPYSYY